MKLSWSSNTSIGFIKKVTHLAPNPVTRYDCMMSEKSEAASLPSYKRNNKYENEVLWNILTNVIFSFFTYVKQLHISLYTHCKKQ